MNWQIAVKTSKRKWETLTETVKSIRAAGWRNAPVLISTEKNWEPPAMEGIDLAWNRYRPGPWPHFISMVHKLIKSHNNADYYLLSEDDAKYARGLREYLDMTLPAFEHAPVGAFSLYCDRKMAEVTNGFGWSWVPAGVATYGSVALVMRPDALKLVALAPCESGEDRGTDTQLGQWLQQQHLQWLVHRPSLVEHTGVTSTTGHVGLEDKRRAMTFWDRADWI